MRKFQQMFSSNVKQLCCIHLRGMAEMAWQLPKMTKGFTLRKEKMLFPLLFIASVCLMLSNSSIQDIEISHSSGKVALPFEISTLHDIILFHTRNKLTCRVYFMLCQIDNYSKETQRTVYRFQLNSNFL